MRLEAYRAVVAADNRAASDMISSVLRTEGLRNFVRARDAAEALALCYTRSPDFLILDLELTHDALTAVRQVRSGSMGGRRELPVIVITAIATRSNIETMRDAGVTEIISKPLTGAKLLARVAAVLTRPRPFIHSANFIGPDRRRSVDPTYSGPARRRGETQVLDIDVA